MSKIFGKNSRYTEDFKAVSFYGYVAAHYPKGDEARFFKDIEAMDAAALKREALERVHDLLSSIARKAK